MDVAILVVNAVHGIMPETNEHLFIAKKMNVKDIIVFVNKTDLESDSDMLDITSLDIKHYLDIYGYSGENKIIYGSALEAYKDNDKNKSIQKLLDTLDNIDIPNRSNDVFFNMPIENVYSITGIGTVVTGKVEQGSIQVGDSVNIIGFDKDKKSIVKNIKSLDNYLKIGQAGNYIGLLLDKIEIDDVEKGQIITVPGSKNIKSYKSFEGYFEFIYDLEIRTSIKNYSNLQLYFKTAIIEGRVELSDYFGKIESSDKGNIHNIRIHLRKPLPIFKDDNLIIRQSGLILGYIKVNKILS